MEPDLNQYASTIAAVFEQLAELYRDGEPLTDVAANIVSILDPDVCAEIISTARAVEE